MKKNTNIYVLLFLVSIIWGAGYVFSEVALENGWSVYSILFMRNFLSFLVVFPIAIKSKFWKNKKLLKIGIIGGLIYIAGYIFQLTGQKYTTVSNTGLITSISIIFVPLLYWLFFKKKPQTYAFIACLLGLVGAIILSYQPGFKIMKGDFVVFISAILYALHLVYMGKNGDEYDLFGLSATQFFVMSVVSLIGIFASGSSFVGEPKGWIGVLPYALLSSAFGVVAQLYAQRIIESYKVSLVLTLEGLFGAIFSIILLSEPITPQVVIGGIIMLAAVFFMQLMDIRYKKKHPEEE